MQRLDQTGEPVFPPANRASPEGLIAVGGSLEPRWLLAAYRQGVFPWYNPGQPILWWSPNPRTVLLPTSLHVSRSLRKILRQQIFEVRFDSAFDEVLERCAGPRRQYPGGGTWITPEMKQAYSQLHKLGYAHSIETWRSGILRGGVYGVALGRMFFGESMFSLEPNASKVALTYAVRQLQAWGYLALDCQMPSAHLASLGAQNLPREQFLQLLSRAIEFPSAPGPWQLELSGVIA